MELLIEKPTVAFNLEQIERGNLLWGRHRTWNEGKAGFVTSATENQLIVQYYPGIGNVTNHFIILVDEVVDGQWEIRWFSNKMEMHGYVIKADGEQQETEGDEDGNAGGIDS